MTTPQWEEVKNVFHDSLPVPLESRGEFLSQHCSDDVVRAEVERLLAEYTVTKDLRIRPQDVLDVFQAEHWAGVSMAARDDFIGPYRLVQEVGRGGMGDVWLAEQEYPIRRRVAIKLIKSGMNTREVVARFESERQALALMDHPAIAKVLDAGSTSKGAPYFVMEYVPGISITQYCDKHRLTTKQRLELFIPVCEGVQHAHQKAIIHRDLKPSNILVTEVDGKPMPKIIDFGVAKAIGQRLTAETMYTQLGAIIGTLGYMSPEQAELSREDVDTRSDVYSLGVVLYELLVGVVPFEFRGMALDEALRRLRQDDARKPSTALRTQGEVLETTAENRHTDLPTLVREVRGDPDCIVLRALEKERGRRYSTPLELAADIERYLRHEPVTAHSPSVAYKAKKYVRRHRLGVAAGATVILVLIVAAAVTIRQSIRADREAAIAQAVDDFLQNDVLAQASASTQSESATKPNPHLEVRTALDRAAERIGGRFGGQPEVEAAIRRTIGHAYSDLGLYPEARTQFQRALDLYRKELGPESSNTLETMSLLGLVAEEQGKYPEAEALLRQTLNLQQRVLGPQHPATLNSMNRLAGVYEYEGKYKQAEALHSRTLETRRRVLGPDHPDTLKSMGNLADVYEYEGKYAKAEALDRQAQEIRQRVLGPEHPDTLLSMGNLADVYEDEGMYARAETLDRQALEIRRRVLGPEHPDVLVSMNNLALVYEDEGKYAQAEALFERALEAERRVLGPEHPNTLMSMGNLADVYGEESKYAQAEALFGQTLEAERRKLGPEHEHTLLDVSSLASVYQEQGKYDMAERYAAQALAGQRHALGSEHPNTMRSAALLALALISQRKFTESEPLARESLNFFRRDDPDSWETFRIESLLGASLAGQRRYVEAEPLLVKGYQGMLSRKDRTQVINSYYLNRAHDWIVQLYQAWGKSTQAAEWARK